MSLLGIRVHLGNIENASVRIDESDRQCNSGVLHPHGSGLGARIRKYHSAVFGELFAEHQSAQTVLLGVGDLCSNFMPLYPQGIGDQRIGLRCQGYCDEQDRDLREI